MSVKITVTLNRAVYNPQAADHVETTVRATLQSKISTKWPQAESQIGFGDADSFESSDPTISGDEIKALAEQTRAELAGLYQSTPNAAMAQNQANMSQDMMKNAMKMSFFMMLISYIMMPIQYLIRQFISGSGSDD